MADRPSSRTTSVAEAMDRVLAREREAQDQLESCHREVEQILADARETARRVQETTQRRISRIHAASNRATAARIRDMRRETSKKTAAIDHEPTQSEAVARAASRLARRLTSRNHDD